MDDMSAWVGETKRNNNMRTIFFYLAFKFSLLATNIDSRIKEKYHKYPTIKYCHNYSGGLFEEYSDWLYFDDFNYFKLYSSYPKKKNSFYIIGLAWLIHKLFFHKRFYNFHAQIY
jgi:hypothetical protein